MRQVSPDTNQDTDIHDDIYLVQVCWEVKAAGDRFRSQSNCLTCSVEVTLGKIITAKYCDAWGWLEGLPSQGCSPSKTQVLVLWKS